MTVGSLSGSKLGKSFGKSTAAGSKKHVIFLLVTLCGTAWILYSGIFNDAGRRLSSTSSKYVYQPHFPGKLGRAALDKLVDWNDQLFMSTMTMYRLKAKSICAEEWGKSPECVAATDKRRPPEPQRFELYDLFNPYIECPDGQPLERVGDDEDGGKFLCTGLMKRKNCAIFSLGSNGQYDFERGLLESTDCNIYTFDCTYDGVSQGPRHTYIKKCIGTTAKEDIDDNFITLANAVKELGVSKIDLLKIDIEGYEFDEMAYWSIRDSWLPEQVAIEVHHSKVIYNGLEKTNSTNFSNLLWPAHHLDLSDLALFFGHLGNLGYAIASREDNPHGGCCSEFLLVRVVDWT